MAATNGKVSLSSLQAQLRKGPAAKGAQPAVQQVQQGVKRVLGAAADGDVGLPAMKKIIVKSAVGVPVARPAPSAAAAVRGPAIAKVPSTLSKGLPQGLAKAPLAKVFGSGVPIVKAGAPTGFIAKVPAAGPRPGMLGGIFKAPAGMPGGIVKAAAPVASIAKVAAAPPVNAATAKKSGGAPPPTTAAAPAKVPAAAPASAGAAEVVRVAIPQAAPVPRLPDGSVALAGIRELVTAIESCEHSAQIRSIARLAETMGSTMAIDHINYFLRALKTKVVDRAKQSGVRVASAPAAVAGQPAQPPQAPAVALPAQSKGPPQAPAVVKTAAPLVRPPVAPPKPKPPQPRPQAAAARAPSPSAAGSEEDLLALVGYVTENPVIVDGLLDEARLGEVLSKLWGGVAQNNKAWIAAWQAMTIPVDRQSDALNKFLTMTFLQGEDSDRAPSIVAELVKAHKVKMRSVEDVLVAFGNSMDGILAVNENAWHIYAYFLVHVFPKPSGTGWGWFRVGWSWQSWFKFVEQCLQSLDGNRASDVISMILRLIQEREGQPLAEVQAWIEGDKLQRCAAKIAELCGCEAAEAADRLAQEGVAVAA